MDSYVEACLRALDLQKQLLTKMRGEVGGCWDPQPGWVGHRGAMNCDETHKMTGKWQGSTQLLELDQPTAI